MPEPPWRTTASRFPGSLSAALVFALALLVAQAEEAGSVPVGAGDQASDRGEARVGLSEIGIAAIQHDDAMDGAGPFPDELGAGLDPAPTQRRKDRGRIFRFRQAVEQTLGRAIETSEGLDLEVIGDRPEQELALEAGGVDRQPEFPALSVWRGDRL